MNEFTRAYGFPLFEPAHRPTGRSADRLAGWLSRRSTRCGVSLGGSMSSLKGRGAPPFSQWRCTMLWIARLNDRVSEMDTVEAIKRFLSNPDNGDRAVAAVCLFGLLVVVWL